MTDITKEMRQVKRLSRRIRSGTHSPFKQKIKKKILFFAIALLFLGIIIPPYLYPVKGIITSRYGFRKHPFKTIPTLEFHPALDIAAPMGTSLKASAHGMVVRAGNMYGYGNFVEVKHLFGFSTMYGHMQRISVIKGMPVFQGSSIGTIGSTGLSHGPHVHFEVRWGGKKLPPWIFLLGATIRKRIVGF